MPPATNEFTVNDRTYRPPARPVAVICIDGCADEYLDTSLALRRPELLSGMILEAPMLYVSDDLKPPKVPIAIKV